MFLPQENISQVSKDKNVLVRDSIRGAMMWKKSIQQHFYNISVLPHKQYYMVKFEDIIRDRFSKDVSSDKLCAEIIKIKIKMVVEDIDDDEDEDEDD